MVCCNDVGLYISDCKTVWYLNADLERNTLVYTL